MKTCLNCHEPLKGKPIFCQHCMAKRSIGQLMKLFVKINPACVQCAKTGFELYQMSPTETGMVCHICEARDKLIEMLGDDYRMISNFIEALKLKDFTPVLDVIISQRVGEIYGRLDSEQVQGPTPELPS